MSQLKRLRDDIQGLSTVEYTILIVVIVAAGMAAWMNFGSSLKSVIGSS